jgi:lambda repressor-like predicted transcriptional regulator
MQTSRKQDPSPRRDADGVPAALEVLPAYLEKSAIVQAIIRDLLKIALNEQLPAAERKWAETAIQDALFRHTTSKPGQRGAVVTREDREKVAGLKEAHERMEEEERVFAANLARLLQEQNLSQAELARRVGVGPSAISMMLSRRCRPQRRTVEKIAQALGVDVCQLWPD